MLWALLFSWLGVKRLSVEPNRLDTLLIVETVPRKIPALSLPSPQTQFLLTMVGLRGAGTTGRIGDRKFREKFSIFKNCFLLFRNTRPETVAVVKENDEHIDKIVKTLGRDGLDAMAGANDDIIDKNDINLKVIINVNPKARNKS